MNRYDRYPGDYVRDTLDLSLAEDGAYTRLLDWYYANERAVPDDRKFAVTRATSVDDQKITQWVLSRFFILRNGEWHHERADQEIKKARSRIETARLNGKLGGRPRQNGATALPQKTQSEPNSKPTSEPRTNPERKLPSPSPPVKISVATQPRRVSLDTSVEPRSPDSAGPASREDAPGRATPASDTPTPDERPQSVRQAAPRPGNGHDADIRRVFDSWKQDTGKYRAQLDPKRKARIAARLRDGFTADELILAITNRRNDPFLMGQNDSGRVYDDIPTLLRDVPQVERLRDLKQPLRGRQGAPPPKQPNSGFVSERMTRG